MQQRPSTGPFSVLLANVDEASAREVMQTFSHALHAGVFGERIAVSPVKSRDGKLQFDILAETLPDHAWHIVSNLLHFSGGAGTGATMLVQTAAEIAADQSISVQAFELAPPVFAGTLELEQWYEHVDDFRIEIEFATSLDAAARDAVCEDLDAWAALIDRGALPDPAYPDVASVIGGVSIRFEDPATVLVEGEGMVCAPNAAATLLIALFSSWAANVVALRFEGHG